MLHVSIVWSLSLHKSTETNSIQILLLLICIYSSVPIAFWLWSNLMDGPGRNNGVFRWISSMFPPTIPRTAGNPHGMVYTTLPPNTKHIPQNFLVGDLHHLETRQWGCLIYFNIMGMGLTRETELPQLLFLLDILSPSWVLMRYSWILMIIVTIPNCGWLLWHTGDKMAILWRLNWDIRRSNYKPIKPRKIKWNWKKRSTYVVYHHIHHLLILVLQ